MRISLVAECGEIFEIEDDSKCFEGFFFGIEAIECASSPFPRQRGKGFHKSERAGFSRSIR